MAATPGSRHFRLQLQKYPLTPGPRSALLPPLPHFSPSLRPCQLPRVPAATKGRGKGKRRGGRGREPGTGAGEGKGGARGTGRVCESPSHHSSSSTDPTPPPATSIERRPPPPRLRRSPAAPLTLSPFTQPTPPPAGTRQSPPTAPPVLPITAEERGGARAGVGGGGRRFGCAVPPPQCSTGIHERCYARGCRPRRAGHRGLRNWRSRCMAAARPPRPRAVFCRAAALTELQCWGPVVRAAGAFTEGYINLYMLIHMFTRFLFGWGFKKII